MKKMIAFLLALVMVLSMGACSKEADTTGDGSGENQELTIGLALSGITSNAIFIDMTKDIQAKCDEAGYKLMTADIQAGTAATVTALENFISGGCDVIIFQNSAEEAYADLMQQALDAGIGIIMISSDMEEIIAMSDRMVVLCEGKQTGSLEKEEFTQENILAYASGSK